MTKKGKLTDDMIRIKMPILAFLTQEELVESGYTTEEIERIKIEKTRYLKEMDRTKEEVYKFYTTEKPRMDVRGEDPWNRGIG